MRPGRLDLMIRHIGFAERWLARARAECTRGHVVRGALTLLLAEAEVHHAREAVTPDATVVELATRTPRSNRSLVAAAALMIAVVAVILASGAGSGPRVVQDTASLPAPVVVRLNHEVGSVLALVPSTSSAAHEDRRIVHADRRVVEVEHVQPVMQRKVKASPVETAPASIKANPPSPTKRVLSVGPEPIARRGAVRSTQRLRVARLDQKRRLAAAPVSSPVRPAGSDAQTGVISDADLIDLVLAAERSLRTGNR